MPTLGGIGSALRLVAKRGRAGTPLIWGLAYLIMIPAFAGIYATSSEDFFQGTATHEPSFVTYEIKATDGLARAVARVVEDESVIEFPKEVPAQITAFPYLPLSVGPQNLTLSVGFQGDLGESRRVRALIGSNTISTESVSVTIPLQVLLNQEYTIMEDAPSQREYAVAYSIPSHSLVSHRATSKYDIIGLFDDFVNSDRDSTSSATFGVLGLPKGSYMALVRIADAENGLVQGLPEQFVRMVYFSATTATTLGFGDITPVTSAARLEVTGEAVLGVVLVGLFLNSLAVRPRRSEDQDDPPPSQT